MKQIINKIKLTGLLAGIAFAMYSCYPGGAEFTEDLDLVMTYYNDTYDFAGDQTYFMPDSIIHIVGEGEEDNISRALDDYILSEFARNMENAGYTRLDTLNENNLPDVVVLPALNVRTNTNVYYYPWYDYWGYYPWYPGYGWGGGWGWYYPPGAPIVTSYEIGTVSFSMVDPEQSNAEKKELFVAWSLVINGLLGTSKTATQQRITWGIDQAFTQSKYLFK